MTLSNHQIYCCQPIRSFSNFVSYVMFLQRPLVCRSVFNFELHKTIILASRQFDSKFVEPNLCYAILKSLVNASTMLHRFSSFKMPGYKTMRKQNLIIPQGMTTQSAISYAQTGTMPHPNAETHRKCTRLLPSY